MADMHQQNLLSGISSLFNNRNYCDLTIECGGRQFYASRVILCSVSTVLARECSSGMQEDHTGLIKHETFDADTMERMLSYIYRQTYAVKGEDVVFDEATNFDPTDNDEDVWGFAPDSHKVLIAHANVFGIADYYDIPTLGALAAQRFRDVAMCGIRPEKFVEVIKVVDQRDNSHSGNLRNALRECSMQYRTRLIANEDFMEDLAAADGVQDFLLDMLRATALQIAEIQKDHDAEIRECEERKETLEERLRDLIKAKDEQIRAQKTQSAQADVVTKNLASSIAKLPVKCARKKCGKVLGDDLYISRRDVDAGPGKPVGSWEIICRGCDWVFS